MTHNWFETKIRYSKMGENGVEKKVTESYLVDALSCTEAKANAQLMATAPELLSALIKLVKEVNETVVISCPTFYAEEVIKKALNNK